METHTEPFCGTFSLELAGGGQRLTGWNAGMVANTFGAVRGDDEMDLASLPRQSRQQRTDDALIVGVSEHGQ
jgi:hypothetical protein